MSQAEELLKSAASTRTVNPDTEPHIVIGDDRFITVPAELKRIAVQGDHDVETVTFDCPRYWDNHDLSEMQIYINYARPDESLGSHLAENVRVDEVDDTIIHFDWTISSHVSEIKGKMSFLVCAKYVTPEVPAVTKEVTEETAILTDELNEWTWTELGLMNCIDGIYGNGVFIILCNYGGYIYRSTDGNEWYKQQISDNVTFISITYGNGKFVAIGTKNGVTVVYSSEDGLEWSDMILDISTDDNNPIVSDICYGNNKFVIVGTKNFYSIDGVTWENGDAVDNTLKTVCYGDGKFVAHGKNNTVCYSTNGINWFVGELDFAGQTPQLESYDICYGDNLFVSVGLYGACACSTDGIHWVVGEKISANEGAFISLTSITFVNGLFIACAEEYPEDGGTVSAIHIYQSSTGIIWAKKATFDTVISNVNTIVYGNGKFYIPSGVRTFTNEFVTETITTTKTVVVEEAKPAEVTNHWNSEINEDMYISEGMETEETIIESNPDIFAQLMAMVEETDITTSQYAEAAEQSATDAAASAAEAKTYLGSLTDEAAQAAASAEAAEQSATNAATSETNAKASETNAATSETNAKASEEAAEASAMEASDRVGEARMYSQQASESASNAAVAEMNAQTSADQAAGKAEAAATSATEAKLSEEKANTYKNSAESYKGQAFSAANSAKGSATNAATSEANAKTSETNAATSETNAKASETSATTSATNAKNSANAAAHNASMASTKASDASKSATAAAESADTASDKADSATTSASNASNSAISASNYATNAKNSATAAATSETNAKESEAAAKLSETNAAEYASEAKASEEAAADSAKAAEAAALSIDINTNDASGYAQAAEQSATRAAQSAMDATKEVEVITEISDAASASADAAAASATEAKLSEEKANTYKNSAESYRGQALSAADSARGSATNAATSEANAKASEEAAAKSATDAKTSEENALQYSNNAQPLAQSVSGNNPTASNSTDGGLIYLKDAGYTEQKALSGKNKFKPTQLNLVKGSGVTCTKQEDGIYVLNGTASGEVQFETWETTIVADGLLQRNLIKLGGSYTGTVRHVAFDASYGNSVSKPLDESATLNNGITYKCFRVILLDGTVCNNLKVGFMVAEDTTEWEPYCGETASPNPDYPQRIGASADKGYFDGVLKQGGYLSSNGNYDSSHKYMVCGSNAISCKEGDSIQLTYEEKAVHLQLYFYGADGFISYQSADSTDVITAIAPSGTTYCHIRIDKATTETLSPSTAKHICVTINGQYVLRVKTTNSNIMPISKVGSAWELTDNNSIKNLAQNTGVDLCKFILKAGKTYKINFILLNKPSGNSSFTGYINNTVVNELGFMLFHGFNLNQVYTRTYKPSTDCKLTYTLWGNENSETFEFQLWCNEDEVRDYEHHTETTALIPVSAPLYDGDYIEVYADGSGREYRNKKHVNLEDLSWTLSVENGRNRFVAYVNGVAQQVANGIFFKITNYTAFRGTSQAFYATDKVATLNNSNVWGERLVILNDDCTTLDDFKATLTGQYLVAPLATPTSTPLTAEQVAEFRKLQTFKGVTHVTADGEVTMRYYVNNDSGETVEMLSRQVEDTKEELQSQLDTKVENVPCDCHYIQLVDSTGKYAANLRIFKYGYSTNMDLHEGNHCHFSYHVDYPALSADEVWETILPDGLFTEEMFDINDTGSSDYGTYIRPVPDHAYLDNDYFEIRYLVDGDNAGKALCLLRVGTTKKQAWYAGKDDLQLPIKDFGISSYIGLYKGKPLRQMTFTFGALPNATESSYTYNPSIRGKKAYGTISDVFIDEVHSFVKDADGKVYSVNTADWTCYVDGTYIYFKSNIDASAYEATVALQFTVE